MKLFLKIFLLLSLLYSCRGNSGQSEKSNGGAVYVSPSIDKYGRFRKGHVRFPVSTKKDAYKNRIRSKYYYNTRGKYNRKRRK